MSVRYFSKHVFHDVGGVEAGLHGEIAEQTAEDCVKVGMYVAAEAPFQGFSFKRVSWLQFVARALPDVKLTEGLDRLKIGMNPFIVTQRDDTPFALVDEEGKMRLTRNVPEEERKRVLAYDVSNVDEARANRIAFYLESNHLDAPPGVTIPNLTPEIRTRLQGKCEGNGLALPMLRNGGGQFAVFNDSNTVTIVTGDPGDINPRIYNRSLGFGVMLPLSEAFIGSLNDGSIQRFSYSVNSADDNALEISVSFTLDGEVITHTVTRKTVTYEGAAFAVCSFGKWGALLLCNDKTITISPAEHSMVPCFAGNTWRVCNVRGGVRYICIGSEDGPLGVVELPDGAENVNHENVTLCYDLGDTSFAGVWYRNPENPMPVRFDSTVDVHPLVIASQADIDMMCNGSWLPVHHEGTSRSISQMFRDGDGRAFAPAIPYLAARPFIDQAGGYGIEHSAKNGLYAGFKSRGIIRNQAQEEESMAYKGATAAILLLGLHQVLQHGDQVTLRLSHPNNPGYRETFQGYINNVLELVSKSLTDWQGNGFRFSTVEYIDEATCNLAGIYKKGVNGQLGTYFVNNIASDMGGSTTDVSFCVANRKVLLPAIPIAGRIVTIQSLIQVGRVVLNGNSNGLSTVLRNVSEEMKTVLTQEIALTRTLLGSGVDVKTSLVQMVDEAEMAEAMQTLLDYFPLDLDREKCQLLQSLVCFKDLLVEDIILHHASRFYTEDDLTANPLYLLRLGNGSRCVDLICGEDSPFNNSRAVLEQVLRDRAIHWINKNANLQLLHNKKPKTEVTNGLSCYNAEEDGSSIERWLDDTTVGSTRELGETCLDEAVSRTMELVTWLNDVVPRICGQIQPLYGFGLNGFSQLLEGLSEEIHCSAALRYTLQHENGRFGNVNQQSASMAVDIWVANAIMDHVNRQLAEVQVKQMNNKAGVM